MANYRRTATGNWTTLAQWQDDSSGSYQASTVLPGANDVVYANNFTVTLDVDVTVLELRTNTATNVNAGGLFDFGTGNNVTANIFSGNSTCVRNNTANTKNITGNVVAGVQSSAGAVQNQALGTINLFGNALAGNGFQSYAIWNENGTVNVYGNITGGSSNSSSGVRNNSQGFINIFGIAEGGNVPGNTNPTTTNVGVLNNSTGTIYVTLLKSSTTGAGATHGNIVASSGSVIVNSVEYASNGFPISIVPLLFAPAGQRTVTVQIQNGGQELLTDNSVVNYPSQGDVRQGVQYGSNNIFTGNLVVSGLSAADVWNYALSNGFASGSIGESLAGVRIRTDKIPDFPTSVQTTGDQIASFNV
jgi:hypothetical protein